MSVHQKQSWEQFSSRYAGFASFFAVIDTDGNWVDSALSFQTAIHFACAHSGLHHLNEQEELDFISNSKYSFVHSKWLRGMYEAGLIK